MHRAEGDASIVELRLAGSMQVRRGDRTLGEGDLGGRRPRLLLAALALHPARALTRHELTEVLWGDEPPATASAAVRVAASRARSVLAKILGADAADPVPSTRSGYALELPTGIELRVDVLVARAQVAAAVAAIDAGAPADAVELLKAARPALERPLLGEEVGRWIEAQRDAVRADLVVALETLADARLALNDAVRAAAAAADAVAVAPYRESAHRLLMRAYAASGNEGEALRAYERCRRLLATDLGATPAPATQALYARLLGEEPRRPAPSIALPGRLRLVGRDRPLAALHQLLTDASAGHGAVALVTGEAGIGKTRVARELIDGARAAGARVLWGTCREPEWAPPFGAVIDLLPGLAGLAPTELTDRLSARLVDDAATVPSSDPLRVREDVRRALLAAAQVQPLVVVIDDVHWADDGTLAALRHLAPSVPTAPLLLLLTAREEEIAPDDAAGIALAALTRDPGLVRLPLAALDVNEIDELARSVHAGADAAWASAIHSDTGGNPFFVESLLLHAIESGDEPTNVAPTAVRDVVMRRLGRLSGDAQALLRAASLVDSAFALSALARAAELDDDAALGAIEEAMAARFVVAAASPDTYEFCHAIARHAIAEGIAPSRRVRLHRSVAEAIEANSQGVAGPTDSAELAGQYHRSASLPGAERGVAHALRAADHADAAGGADRAAAFLAIALDLMPADDPRRSELTARRGLALVVGPRHGEGAAVVRRAADELVDAGNARAAAALLADAAWSAELAGYTEEAFALGSAGLPLVEGGPEDDVWARLYLLELRRQEADDPRGLGLPIMTPQRRRAAELLHRDPAWRFTMAWAVWDNRSEILERGRDDAWALTMWAGRYGEALALWQRQATAAEARGQLAEAVSAWAGAASCAIALGHLADAERWTDHARELARRIELRGAFALHLVGARDQLVHARGTGLDDLVDWIAELTIYRTDRAQRWAEAIQYAAMGRLFAIDGRADDARTMIDGVVEVLPAAPPTVVSTNRMVGDVVEACWLIDDGRHLSVLADAVHRMLLDPDFRCPMTEPRHAQARLVGMNGDVEGARHWFAEARVVAAEDGLRPLRALIDHDEAVLLLRAGDADAAAPLLDAASRQATVLGMVGWVRRVERLALGTG